MKKIAVPASLPHQSPTHRRLAIRCARWGGKLMRIPASDRFWDRVVDDRRWSPAPFVDSGTYLAIHWAKKLIAYDNAPWPQIVHEMGHVFASRRGPSNCNEIAFFGWEYALVLRLDDVRPWLKDNASYIVENFKTLESYSKKRREELLCKCVVRAQARGLINEHGTPVAIR